MAILMTNPYDHAYGLARAIRQTNEFTTLQHLKKQIEENETYKEMLLSYHQLHIEIQTIRMQGIDPTPEFKERAEKTTLAIQGIPVIMEYLQAEERFSILVNDLQKIVLEPVQEIMDFSNKEA